jgi:hypothetical protein
MINPHKTIPVGTEVKVKGTTHFTKVKSVKGKWHELEEKSPNHKLNAYGIWELVIVKHAEAFNG